VLQVRRTLEVEGARLAATERTDDELTDLTRVLAERNTAVLEQQWDAAVDADTRFHQSVVRCSHNTLLTELYQGLTEVVRASVAATAGQTIPAWNIDHDDLLNAIRAGDPDRAAHEAGTFLAELLADPS
jgi:DNA-binding FadR family transcriptional regulator